MTNLFSVLKLLCLDTLFLFCSLVAAKMKQRDEKWHYQDLLDLAVAPFPPICPDSWGTQQLLAEAEGAISGQANIAWRSPAVSQQSPVAKEKTTQPLLLGASLLLKNHSVYQISSKGCGEWKEDFETVSDAFCKTWRTQASFWLFELFGFGSAALGMKGAIEILYIDVIAKEGCHKMLSKL